MEEGFFVEESSKKCSQDVWRERYWGERKEARHFLASPRYLTGERTDQRSLSMLGEWKTFAAGSSASRLQSPCSIMAKLASSLASWASNNTQTNVASSNNHRCANVDIYHPTTIHTNITSSNNYKKHVVSYNNTQNKAMSSSNSYLWTLSILGNYFQKRKFWTYQNKKGRYC